MAEQQLQNLPGYDTTKSGLYIPTQIKADALSDIRNPTAWLTEWALGRTSAAGIPVSHVSVMGLSTYYACIRAISEDIGKIPLITYRRVKPRGKERAVDHPNYELLHDAPNTEMEALTFRETLTAHALSWGNGYAEIEHDSQGEAVALWPIHPSRVRIRRDESGTIVYDVFGSEMVEGQRRTQVVRIRSENILHIRGLGAEGLYGYSILDMARESFGLSLAAQRFGAAFFANGAHITGVLEHPGELGDVAAKRLRESWMEIYSGVDKAGTPAILEEGMKWTAISLPPDQAQFLETRNFQVREVARWFRMPLHKVQDLADASFNNIEHQSLDYVSDTLSPWMVRWEQQIKRKLFRNDPEHFAEHLIVALLRTDQRSRSAFYRIMLSLAALSPNDIREAENLNSIGPAGDKYFIASNNLTPIEQTLIPAEPAPQDEIPKTPELPKTPEPPSRLIPQTSLSNGAHY